MSTIITNLRGARVTPIHRGSVLLFKQEDLCSTSYYSPSRKISALRVITLREGRILPLYESLLSKQEDLCSTSYYSPLGILLLYELLFELYLAINNSSTSHSPLGVFQLYELLGNDRLSTYNS